MSRTCLCCGKPIEGRDQGGWHPACIKRFFHTAVFPDFSLLNKEIDELIAFFLSQSHSLSGVQPKFSAGLGDKGNKTRFTLTSAMPGYIVKPQSPSYSELPEYEQTTMLLAEECGLPVVPHGLVQIKPGELTYLCQRIDRNGAKKLAMEDFCQLSLFPTEYKYQGSYEGAFRRVIDKYSEQGQIAAIRYFLVILFSYMVGNTDMHLKNFSLVRTNNHYVLAPFYDLLPAEIIAKQKEMALTLNGKNTNLRPGDFRAFGEYIGLGKGLSDNLVKQMADRLKAASKTIEDSPLSNQGKAAFEKLIKTRISQLEF